MPSLSCRVTHNDVTTSVHTIRSVVGYSGIHIIIGFRNSRVLGNMSEFALLLVS